MSLNVTNTNESTKLSSVTTQPAEEFDNNINLKANAATKVDAKKFPVSEAQYNQLVVIKNLIINELKKPTLDIDKLKQIADGTARYNLSSFCNQTYNYKSTIDTVFVNNKNTPLTQSDLQAITLKDTLAVLNNHFNHDPNNTNVQNAKKILDQITVLKGFAQEILKNNGQRTNVINKINKSDFTPLATQINTNKSSQTNHNLQTFTPQEINNVLDSLVKKANVEALKQLILGENLNIKDATTGDVDFPLAKFPNKNKLDDFIAFAKTNTDKEVNSGKIDALEEKIKEVKVELTLDAAYKSLEKIKAEKKYVKNVQDTKFIDPFGNQKTYKDALKEADALTSSSELKNKIKKNIEEINRLSIKNGQFEVSSVGFTMRAVPETDEDGFKVYETTNTTSSPQTTTTTNTTRTYNQEFSRVISPSIALTKTINNLTLPATFGVNVSGNFFKYTGNYAIQDVVTTTKQSSGGDITTVQENDPTYKSTSIQGFAGGPSASLQISGKYNGLSPEGHIVPKDVSVSFKPTIYLEYLQRKEFNINPTDPSLPLPVDTPEFSSTKKGSIGGFVDLAVGIPSKKQKENIALLEGRYQFDYTKTKTISNSADPAIIKQEEENKFTLDKFGRIHIKASVPLFNVSDKDFDLGKRAPVRVYGIFVSQMSGSEDPNFVKPPTGSSPKTVIGGGVEYRLYKGYTYGASDKSVTKYRSELTLRAGYNRQLNNPPISVQYPWGGSNFTTGLHFEVGYSFNLGSRREAKRSMN